jgi:hypothetical protein
MSGEKGRKEEGTEKQKVRGKKLTVKCEGV